LCGVISVSALGGTPIAVGSIKPTVSIPSISVSPTIGAFGTQIAISGYNFANNTPYSICFSSQVNLCGAGTQTSVTSSSNGTLSAAVAAAGTSPGINYVLVLSASTVVTGAGFYVPSSSINLSPS